MRPVVAPDISGTTRFSRALRSVVGMTYQFQTSTPLLACVTALSVKRQYNLAENKFPHGCKLATLTRFLSRIGPVGDHETDKNLNVDARWSCIFWVVYLKFGCDSLGEIIEPTLTSH